MKDFSFDYEKLYRLGTSQALDYLYEMMEEFLFAGRYDLAEQIMVNIDLDRGQTALACGILTVTLIWDEVLPSRPAFYQRAYEYYRTRDKDADAILDGLERYEPFPGVPSLRDFRVTRWQGASKAQ